jgi:nucleosome assembly protein 1-like 1
LTQKLLKKKPKKGSKNAKPITKTEECESFFNFFSPPQVPEDDEDIDEDTVMTSFITSIEMINDNSLLVFNSGCFFCHLLEQAEELQNQMEQDYDIG